MLLEGGDALQVPSSAPQETARHNCVEMVDRAHPTWSVRNSWEKSQVSTTSSTDIATREASLVQEHKPIKREAQEGDKLLHCRNTPWACGVAYGCWMPAGLAW